MQNVGRAGRTLLGGLIGLLALACLIAAQSASAAGVYNVAECSPGHPATPDATASGNTTAYSAATSCESGNWLQVQSGSQSPPGVRKEWAYTAPAYTEIERVKAAYNLVADPDNDGHRSYLFVKGVGQSKDELSTVNSGSTSGIYDSDLQQIGPFEQVGIGMRCGRAYDPCAFRSSGFSRLAGVEFRVKDTRPPETPAVAGAPVEGAWASGDATIGIGDIDYGAGADRSKITVNGTEVADRDLCTGVTDASGYASEMAPCEFVYLHSETLNTRSSVFNEGSNTIRVCSTEFGTAGATTCTQRSIKVDNVAPTAPQSLAVTGGEGWKRDRQFTLSWTNPTQGADGSPIVGAKVRLSGPGGYDSTQSFDGAGDGHIDNVSVPAIGDYTAEVSLVDEASNNSPAQSASVHLRFDNTVPVKARPDNANGWLNRRDVSAGHLQGWTKPSAAQTPVSGIAGYRVVVNTNTDTDPCAGASDPRACSGPLTEVGIDNNTRLLGTGALGEGANYVHAVAVSGSGMRATEIGHTPLKVDLTDPITELRGAPGEWVNHDVNLTALATDALSGMVDTPEYPDDAPPRSVLEVDGVVSEDTDKDVSADMTGEGVHQVRFWARDLAGNENDADAGDHAAGSATVRIDKTDPQVAFTDRQDPADPDKLIAPTSDQLSGVVDGTISYRARGGDWKSLDTSLRGGELVARVDSADLRPGVTYEFRVTATDAAGNSMTSTKRADGSPMSVVGPLRTITTVSEVKVNDKAKAKVGYGERASVSGQLTTAAHQPVSGGYVELVQSFGAGAKAGRKVTMTKTDAGGHFKARLPKGPSRSIVARYAGDRVYLDSSSKPAKLGVRAKISLRVAKRAKAGGKASFAGKIKAKGAKLGGKRIEVQVRIGKRWRAVGRSVRTNKRGKFALRYKFTAAYIHPVRYTFRAVALKERGFPYLPSASKRRSITVYP